MRHILSTCQGDTSPTLLGARGIADGFVMATPLARELAGVASIGDAEAEHLPMPPVRLHSAATASRSARGGARALAQQVVNRE